MTTTAASPTATGRYTSVAIALHWIIALALICQLALGFSLENIPRAERGEFMGVHKSLGITILFLSLVRLAWRLTHKPPPLPAGLKPWEKMLSSSVHVAFYFVMIGAPLGGWAMSTASTRAPPVSFWGMFDLPGLPVPESDALAEQLGAGHAAAGIIAVVLIVLHVGGALKHMFVDDNDVLWRMVPGLRKPPNA
jgi:cytochrome b561